MKTNKQKCIDFIYTLPCPEHPSFIKLAHYPYRMMYKVKRMEYGTNMNECGCDGPCWISEENEYLDVLFSENKDVGSEFEQAICVARIHFLDKNELEKEKLWRELWELVKS